MSEWSIPKKSTTIPPDVVVFATEAALSDIVVLWIHYVIIMRHAVID